jgi:hypothetical protein
LTPAIERDTRDPRSAHPIVLPMSVRFCLFAAASFCALGACADEDAALPPPALTEVWSPTPPSVTVAPDGCPSDAVRLFDGHGLAAWETITGSPDTPPTIPGKPPAWRVIDGVLVIVPKSGHLRTRAAFGDMQLHLEFRTPTPVAGSGQHRGNSGVYFMGRYEIQILDSYRNPTYVNGQAASIYKQHAPLVNASRAPGEWQSLDVVFVAPRFSSAGDLLSPARATVFHNGVLVQHDVALQGPTVFRGRPVYRPHAARLPLVLQDHGSAVAFRNLWARSLTLPPGR